MIKLTIFTPTYNRLHTLEKTYESLKQQSCKDFIWLIIDDGSTDKTKNAVEKWKKENHIEIMYVYKENGGKHTAYNMAVDLVDTELIMISLDSDDYLNKDAVKIILYNWKKQKNNKIVGLATFCANNKGNLIIYSEKKKLTYCTLSEAFNDNLINCSAVFVFKSEYVKKFKYPVYKGEFFFTEAYVYMQMEEPLYWVYEGICIREFRDDGLTKNRFQLYINSPKSWMTYNKLRMEKNKSIILKIKYTIFYIAFSLMCGNKKIIENSKYKLLTILCFPVGRILRRYIQKKGEK